MAKCLRARALAEVKKRGLSVCGFCRKLGPRGSTAEKWLYGIVKNPRIATVQAVFAKLRLEMTT
jgi:hypothetical protein